MDLNNLLGHGLKFWQSVKFYKHLQEGKVAILIVFVDDILLTGDDPNVLERLKVRLAGEFESKDLGSLKYSWDGVY